MVTLARKEIYFILAIIFLSLLIRAPGLDYAPYDDEAMYASAVENAVGIGYNPQHYTPILMQWLQLPLNSLFGTKVYFLRFIPLLFGVGIMILSYLIAREWVSKKAAKITLILLAISFYPTLTSLQLDAEGSLITFFYLLSAFSLLKMHKAKAKKQWWIWATVLGLSLCASLLSKHNAILIFATLGLYTLWIRKGNFFKSVKELLFSYCVGIGGYLLFLGITYLIEPNQLNFMFRHGSQFFTGIHFSIVSLMILCLWATPLLLGPAFLAIFSKKKPLPKNPQEEKNLTKLLITWIVVVIAFYFFIIEWGDYSRYLSNLIPVCALLGGIFLSRFSYSKSDWEVMGILTALFTGLFLFLNAKPALYVAREFSTYLSTLKNGSLNFIFSYTTSSGPTFGINVLTIAITFIIAVLAILFYFIDQKNTKKKDAILILLSVSVAFNVLLIAEFIHHPTTPNISQIQYDMVKYIQDNELELPIYSNDDGINFLIDPAYRTDDVITGYPDYEFERDISALKSRIKHEGGTITLLHWPPLPKNSPAYEVVGMCTLKKQFYDKNYLVGEIYTC